ncbi:adenine phosphoribosyltransferase [Spiroplasma endosymbiont of Amphibalanus improvisus]|uniref:adenine phosphoribosyltransferase n=1 Tax=Spiroplasma endosymbiont of Amphibalanus improvisus TaxID=3066327 RepID=UPI00313D8AD2
MDLKQYIIDVKDFPKKDILFKDITPLLKDAAAFKNVVEQMIDFAKKVGANVIVSPEARGFIFGTAVSYGANIGFVPCRKPNKLPREVYSVKFDLEYNKTILEIHKDSLDKNSKILVVDDVLATGGTAQAIVDLAQKTGSKIVGFSFLIDLKFLKGKELIKNYDIQTLIEY